jgi:outer membrane immunogenic protein
MEKPPMMNKTLFSAIALALAAGAALAADLPSHKGPPVHAPPPPPLWAGFYAGVNAGYTWSESSAVRHVSAPAFLVGPPLLGPLGLITSSTFWASANSVLNPNSDGFIGGGQIGYNRRFGDRFVAGVEADIQGVAGAGGSVGRTSVIPLPVPPFPAGQVALTVLSATKSIDYLGTARGRLGFLVTPSLLVYGTGGLAYGGVHSSAGTFQARNGPVIPFGASGGYSDTRVGWTAGGGGEWMFMPNWSAKVEYLYYDLGAVTYNVGPLAAFLLPPIVPPGTTALGSLSISRAATRFNGHIVRVGLNYHFNLGSAPLLANY